MNRLITRLVFSFVGLSLVASMLPLLESGGGKPLFWGLDRARSLLIYAGFFVTWVLVVFPETMRRDLDRNRPWWLVFGLMFTFATVPLVLSAYISGVSFGGLRSLAAWILLAGGLVLVLHRYLPLVWSGALQRGASIFGVLVLPAWIWHRRSLGLPVPAPWESLSLWDRFRTVVVDRQVPEVWPVLGAALVLIALCVLPARRKVAAALFVPLLWWSPIDGGALIPSGPITVQSQAGGLARPGLRTPILVQVEGQSEAVTAVIGGEAHELRADGRAQSILVAPDREGQNLRVDLGGRDHSQSLPLRFVEDSTPLALVVATANESPVTLPPGIETARILPTGFSVQSGAYEAFDTIVLSESTWINAPAELRAAALQFVARGAELVLFKLGGAVSAEGSVREGRGRITRTRAAELTELELTRRVPVPRVRQPELLRTIVPPAWQELDLSKVILVLLLYHAAFLLAFLLPLVFDAKKSLVVYLASVGFVVVIVAFGGYLSLKRVFLRGNQVYSQSLTLVVASGDGASTWHQLLGYASMSGETTTLQFPAGTDVLLYRGDDAQPRATRRSAGDSIEFAGVELDRFSNKAMVRVERHGRLGFAFVKGDSVLEWSIVPREVEGEGIEIDPSELLEGYQIETDGTVRRLVLEGGKVRRGDRVDQGPFEGPEQVYFRRLMGHLAPELRQYLVFRARRRTPDEAASKFFSTKDLGAFLVIAGGQF